LSHLIIEKCFYGYERENYASRLLNLYQKGNINIPNERRHPLLMSILYNICNVNFLKKIMSMISYQNYPNISDFPEILYQFSEIKNQSNI
jgi:hypothetical protein